MPPPPLLPSPPPLLLPPLPVPPPPLPLPRPPGCILGARRSRQPSSCALSVRMGERSAGHGGDSCSGRACVDLCVRPGERASPGALRLPRAEPRAEGGTERGGVRGRGSAGGGKASPPLASGRGFPVAVDTDAARLRGLLLGGGHRPFSPPPRDHPCLLPSSATRAPVGSELASEGDLEAAETKRIGVKGGGGAVKEHRDLNRPRGCSAKERRETQTGPTAQAPVSCSGGLLC